MVQEIWLSNFDSMIISWNTVIFKFRSDERRILSRQTIHTSSCGSPLTVSFVARINVKTPLEGLSNAVAKIQRNLKMTVEMVIESKLLNQIDMIKASFSSAEDAPFNDVKINNTFSSQCTENPPFCFFWDTRYTVELTCHVVFIGGCRVDRSCNSLLNGISNKNMDRLQSLQNKAARLVHMTPKYYTPTSPHIADLHWLRIPQRIQYKILTLVFKSMHNEVPQYISDLLHIHQSTYNLCSSNTGHS